ncbi:MAG: hypothetical protein AB7J35_06925 [Dehalococcoidia bacterium]
MPRIMLLAVGLMLLGVACTPGLAESSPSGATGAEPTTPAATPTPDTMVGRAEAIVGPRFKGTGYIESIVQIQYTDQWIRLIMGRDTFTLGDLEAFSRMCRALTELIGVDSAQGQVVGVQALKADGTLVVVGTSPGQPCAPPS